MTSGVDTRYPDCPKVAVGAVVFHEGRVLLVLRGQPPAEAQWAIPGGSVELGETLQAAAERELMEETGVRIRAGKPVYVFDAMDREVSGRVRFHYIIIDLHGDYLEGEPCPGDDAADARWVSPEELNRIHVNPRTRKLLRDIYGFG